MVFEHNYPVPDEKRRIFLKEPDGFYNIAGGILGAHFYLLVANYYAYVLMP